MALARVKTWIAGDVLTAADLNGEFNNVLNNPISLLSPTTGAINFNLSAHTNLVPGAVSASSGTAGNALIVSTAATPTAIWGSAAAAIAGLTGLTSGQLIIGASSGAGTALAIGSTGQVLSVTSSNSNPVWGVIPLSGGLTSGAPVSGALFYVSTSGVLTPLGIGTSGQVLTINSVPLPSWAAAASAAAGAFTSQVTYNEDFKYFSTGAIASLTSGDSLFFVETSVNPSYTYFSSAHTVQFVNTGSAFTLQLGTSAVAALSPFLSSLNPDLVVRMAQNSTSTGQHRFGLTDGTFGSGEPTNGIYFRSSKGNGSTYRAISRNAGTEFIIVTSAVSASSGLANTFRITVSSSGTLGTVIVNGVTQGTFTSSQLPAVATPLSFGMAHDNASSNSERYDALQIVQDRALVI